MIIVVGLYYIIALFFEIYTIKKYFITPGFIFVGMQMVMFYGILTYCDFLNTSDCKLVTIYLLTLIMFILGDGFAKKSFPAKINYGKVDKEFKLSKYQKEMIVILVTVASILCLYFFVASGYNVFVMIIKSIISGNGTDNYTNSRIALNNIQGVGYIYQFRVIILPILIAYLITANKETEKLHLLGIVLFPLMIIFLLGTGQRGGFVMFMLMWMVALLYIYKFYKNKKIKKWIIIISSIAFGLFFIMTIFNGRVQKNGTVIQAILSRIFGDNQQCAVIAFRYIDTQPIQYGRDWFLSIKDILPGKNSYVQLSYIVFKIMYGTTRGTAPPCIWGSTYYNWWFFGIIIMPFLMGIFYHKLYARFTRTNVNKLTIFIYSAMFVVLGNWIADTPLVLFNQGFITIVLMGIILKIKNNNRLQL